jgi:hypothetical protein
MKFHYVHAATTSSSSSIAISKTSTKIFGINVEISGTVEGNVELTKGLYVYAGHQKIVSALS